jgi:GTP-binding protein HflX
VGEATKMIEYDARPERAVLVAVLARGADEDRELAEMLELLRTAQVDVVATCVQHRASIHPRTYVGSGKLKELKELAKELEAEVVVTEDELSPSQQRTLEDELGMRIVDRTRVILDIFALHAHSAAGKLQVELAQLEYNLQRMRGMWKHLERLGGGVGTRGPGESQLETDRRLARTRISLLRRRLRELRKQRATMRRRRERNEVPSVALAGYTNVGKSTLLNALTGSEVGVRDRLFHTLDPTTRTLRLSGRPYLLTDTVGFISKLPHQLVDAFAATLEETRRAELLAHVLDASAPEEYASVMAHSVDRTLEEIGAGDRARVLVLNKIDLLDEAAREELRLRHPDAILLSARTGEGLSELGERIERELAHTLRRMELLVPYDEGGSLAELHDIAGDVSREDTADGVRVRALVPERVAERFARFAAPARLVAD